MAGLLWATLIVLVALWFLGFVVVHVGNGLIHLLLLVALFVLIVNLIFGRRVDRG